MPIEPYLMASRTDCGEEAQISVQNGRRSRTYIDILGLSLVEAVSLVDEQLREVFLDGLDFGKGESRHL